MIHLYAKLTVREFAAFEQFEYKANAIMAKYHGRILHAFELRREVDGSGEEIHILEFPNELAFDEYRADCDLVELANLRAKAIVATEVTALIKIKSY